MSLTAMDISRLINRLAVSVSRMAGGALSPFGVSPMDYGILEICRDANGVTGVELAESLMTDTSAISRRVNALVEAGLVSRTRMTDDRRKVLLHLTDEGRTLTRRIAAEMRARESVLVEGVVEDDLRVFASVGQRMMEKVEAGAPG